MVVFMRTAMLHGKRGCANDKARMTDVFARTSCLTILEELLQVVLLFLTAALRRRAVTRKLEKRNAQVQLCRVWGLLTTTCNSNSIPPTILVLQWLFRLKKKGTGMQRGFPAPKKLPAVRHAEELSLYEGWS
ncbi:unnamed protein product [Heterosigma akashiwo]